MKIRLKCTERRRRLISAVFSSRGLMAENYDDCADESDEWNRIPPHIRKLYSVSDFHKALKTHLFSQQL